MISAEKQKQLAAYRIRQADESLDEARYLLMGGKSLRSVANRAYYAMFYAVLALLVYEPFSSSKHTGVLSYFNRRFLKAGVFDRSLGLWLNKAFEMRQRGDYREQVELSREKVEQALDQAKSFVEAVRSYLAGQGKV